MIVRSRTGFYALQGPIERAWRWLDGSLRSGDSELLEREGATPQGIRIIDELNRVYHRTGLWEQATRLVISALQAIPRVGGHRLRVLEVGMRDGALLRQVAERSDDLDLPVELHGVEFRANLAQLAQARQQPKPIEFHVAASPRLLEFPDRSFDLVYSLFSLHHFDPVRVRELLTAGHRVTRAASLHIDLDRSIWGAVSVWSVYSLLGCRQARHDAVLSVRRAYRRDEMSGIVRALELPGVVHAERRLPLSWVMQISRGIR
jgi:SAM-dependent methyltransferase